MKRKSVWGRGLTFLIASVLAVMAFIRGPAEIWLLGIVFAIWAIWMLCAAWIRFKRNRAKIRPCGQKIPQQNVIAVTPVVNDEPTDPEPVGPEVWYDSQGKAALESCITELHYRGYSALTIRENGDICIRQDGSDVKRESLQDFPDRGHWDALVKILEKEGLAASVKDDGIKLTW